MQNVKIANLKNNLSRHLARVRRGGEIIVLDRNTPVARIVPFVHGARSAGAAGKTVNEAAERIADLARQGLVSPGDPHGLADWVSGHRPIRVPTGGPSALDVLLKARRASTR